MHSAFVGCTCRGLKRRHISAGKRQTSAQARTGVSCECLWQKAGACNNKRWQAVTNGGQSVGVALSSAGSDSWRCVGDWVMGSRPLNAHSLGRALCVNTASASPATIGGDVSSFMAQVACSSAIYWALNRIPCSSFTDTPDSTDIQRIEARCHGSRPIDRMHGV